MLKKFLQGSIYLIALTIVSTVGAVLINSALAVWTGPTASPPSGNVENLLNTGATAQTKSGDLAVNKLTAGVGGLCISTDCKTAWSQVTGAASGWTKSGANVYLSTLTDLVGIGTSAPNKQLHLKTATGNAEMDIQSASQNYWALYQDATSGELRYWNNSVTSTSTKNALVITSTGYLKLPTPIAANDAATKGYVDAAVGAAGGGSGGTTLSGSGTWTVPSNVYSIDVTLIGGGAGGGGGGGSYGPVSSATGNPGGGGGTTIFGNLSATGAGGGGGGVVYGAGGAGGGGGNYGNTYGISVGVAGVNGAGGGAAGVNGSTGYNFIIYSGGAGGIASGGAGGGGGAAGAVGGGGGGGIGGDGYYPNIGQPGIAGGGFGAAGGGGGGTNSSTGAGGGGGGSGGVLKVSDFNVIPGQIISYTVGAGGGGGSGYNNANGGGGYSGSIIIGW